MKCSFCNLGWQLPLLPTRWCYIAVTLVPLWKLIRIPQLYKLPHQHTHTHTQFTYTVSQSRAHIQRSTEKSQNYENNYFLLQWFCSVEKAIICTLHSRVSGFQHYDLLENPLSYQILVLFHGTLLRKKQLVDDRLEGGVTYFSSYKLLKSLLQEFFHVYLA